MIRHSSILESVLSYGAFFTLSIVIHMVLICGTRPTVESPALAPQPTVSETVSDPTAERSL